MTAWTPGTLAYGEELPADEMTAVFAPPPELLARSGRQPAQGGGWEEPTRVVTLGVDVLSELAPSTAPPAPASGEPDIEQRDIEQRDIEQPDVEPRLETLATSDAPARRRSWLLWAIVIVLAGAGAAAAADYAIHPGPSQAPTPR